MILLLLYVMLYGLCAGQTLRCGLLRRFFGGRWWLRGKWNIPQKCFRKILRTVLIGILLGARCRCAAVLPVVVCKHQPFPTCRSRTRSGALHARGLLRSSLLPGKLRRYQQSNVRDRQYGTEGKWIPCWGSNISSKIETLPNFFFETEAPLSGPQQPDAIQILSQMNPVHALAFFLKNPF